MIFPGLILICKIVHTMILYIAFVWRLHAVSEELANIRVDQFFELDTRCRTAEALCRQCNNTGLFVRKLWMQLTNLNHDEFHKPYFMFFYSRLLNFAHTATEDIPFQGILECLHTKNW